MHKWHFEMKRGDKYLPDFIIRLPEGKNLIVDSKVSLVDYERAVARRRMLNGPYHSKPTPKQSNSISTPSLQKTMPTFPVSRAQILC